MCSKQRVPRDIMSLPCKNTENPEGRLGREGSVGRLSAKFGITPPFIATLERWSSISSSMAALEGRSSKTSFSTSPMSS